MYASNSAFASTGEDNSILDLEFTKRAFQKLYNGLQSNRPDIHKGDAVAVHSTTLPVSGIMKIGFRNILSLSSLALSIGVACASCSRHADRQSLSGRLSAAQRDWRSTEGRLVGFTFAPFSPSRAMRPWVPQETDRRALAREVRKLASWRAPDALADLALLDLFSGKTDSAIARLTAATKLAPRAGAIWNELTVAYLARNRARGDPYDQVLALEACESSLAFEPGLLAARFNRALIVEALAIPTAAVAAWQDYLTRDAGSPWATDARKHLSQLLKARTAFLSACDSHRFDDALLAGDFTGVDDLIASCPEGARHYAEEELLAAWATDKIAGRNTLAAFRLRLARRIADVISQAGGDDMLVATVAAIETTNKRSPSSLRALEAGLISYRQGLRAFRERRLGAAAAAFIAAETQLMRAHNPFATWATFQHAVSSYYLAKYDASRRQLLGLAIRLPAARFPILRGRIAWILGLLRIVEADPAAALAYYQRGLENCQLGRYMECVAALHSLIAETLSFMGDDRPAWEHRRAALTTAAGFDSTYYQLVFDEPAEAALRRGAPRAARLLQDEALAVAKRLGDPLAFCDALLHRIAIDRCLEDWPALEADRASAEGYAHRIPDPELRRRVEGSLWTAYGDAQAASRPATAALAYSRSIEIFSEIGYRFPLVRLLTARASAWERRGDLVKAAADLKTGLIEVDRQRGALSTREQRLRFFEQSRGLFDGMISLASRSLHDPVGAFRYTEMARSRTLLDASGSRSRALPAEAASRTPSPGPAGPMSLANVRRDLPPSDVLLEFAVLDDRLLRWVVRHEGTTFSEVGIGASALADLIKQHRAALEHPSAQRPQEEAPVLSKLYRLLIPAELLAGKVHRLVIVPDRQLNTLPFAALLDPAKRHFLIEQVEIIVTPSASLYLRGASRQETARSGLSSALVVGDPSLVPDLLPRLAPLPGARHEAQRVASLYKRSRLLLGEQATKREFLASAGRYEVIHFAGHAAAAGENPILFLAGDQSDPGTLTGGEIEKMALPQTRLVVLAACRSGAGDLLETEGPRSAARAFLAAGATAVVASLFNLDDGEVETLVSDLHERITHGADPAAALRAAQLQALAQSAAAGTPTGFGWASLQLIGVAQPVTRN